MHDSPAALAAAFRPVFTVGGTISRAIRVLVDRPLTFVALYLMQMVPFAVWSYGAGALGAGGSSPDDRAREVRAATPALLAAAPVLWFFLLLAFAASVHLTTEHLRGREVSLTNGLAAGVKRVVPLLLVSIVLYVMIVLGLVALIVPGFLVMTAFFMALPVAVLERRGIFGSLGRGLALSKGYHTTLFGIGASLVAISVATLAVSAMVLGLILMAVTGFDSDAAMIIQPLGALVLYFPMTALFPILVATTYHALCNEKEGAASAQVADVFA